MFDRLLVPSVISSLGFALADMADALVVGQKLGETGLAAISLCLSLLMPINLFMDALGIGGSIRFSHRMIPRAKSKPYHNRNRRKFCGDFSFYQGYAFVLLCLYLCKNV